jgi:hypothetical protein
MKYCFRVGLYKQGLIHDLSKYSFPEFLSGIKYYNGNASPHNMQRRIEGHSKSWLHHKGRNKHHFEYWIDYGVIEEEGLKGVSMPSKYVIEMFIDRLCASKNYLKEKHTDKSPLEYYQLRKHYYELHDHTRLLLESLLKKLACDGEDRTLEYIRKNILKNNEN